MYWWSGLLKKWHCSLLGETMKYYLWKNVDVCWLSCNSLVLLGAVTCGSLSTRCRAVLPNWWKPSRGQFGCSRSRFRCQGGSVPSGGGFPRLPEPPYRPFPPSLWAHWQSRCCWWKEMLSGLNAAQTGGWVRSPEITWNYHVIVATCVCSNLNVIIVSDVFISRCDACLDCLDPCLPQLLGLSLQHTTPAGV